MTETKTIISYPILYQTEMIQANLEERKTETRRTTGLKEINENPDEWRVQDIIFPVEGKAYVVFAGSKGKRIINCPYGNIGNYLWVRETWQHTECISEHPSSDLYGYVYRASEPEWEEYEGWQWKPSIHMPKEAARIWLKIKEIRVERLQDITHESCLNEGVSISDPFYWEYFKILWESINGKYSWERNDWTWVIKYEIISTTGKPF